MKNISTQEFERLRESVDNLKVVNVLSEDDFRKAHIPGSINIPVDQHSFIKSVEEATTGKDQPVVVYCANEECSASDTAADKLDAAGFTAIYDYGAGTEGWREAGKPIESD